MSEDPLKHTENLANASERLWDTDWDKTKKRRSSNHRRSRVFRFLDRVSLRHFTQTHQTLDKPRFLEICPHPFLILIARSGSAPVKGLRFRTTPENLGARQLDELPESSVARRRLGELLDCSVLAIAKRDGAPVPERVSMGRAKNCDLVIEFPEVSKYHAYLEQHDSRWTLTDAQSRNGTYINESPLSPLTAYPLPGECQISFGRTRSALFVDNETMFGYVELLFSLL